jgi:hypothetical protein
VGGEDRRQAVVVDQLHRELQELLRLALERVGIP